MTEVHVSEKEFDRLWEAHGRPAVSAGRVAGEIEMFYVGDDILVIRSFTY